MSGYKTAKRSRRDDDSDSEAEAPKPTKATKKVKTAKVANEATGGADKDAEGNSFWPVSWQSIPRFLMRLLACCSSNEGTNLNVIRPSLLRPVEL